MEASTVLGLLLVFIVHLGTVFSSSIPHSAEPLQAKGPSSPSSSPPPPCDSKIYCDGPLLHTVQMSGLFKDSKTFVDMKLKTSPGQVLRNFDSFMRTFPHPGKADIKKFVDNNFDAEGSEFDPWDPTDWHPNPSFLQNITDPHLQSWGTEIHSYWKQLGRKIKDDVKMRPELYSMIYSAHPVIVPGGRFREFFYWDSYWIMKGLLLSEMHDTVKGMLQNFLDMVDFLGYVPNGGRIYFRRSQPPFLIPMVKLYLDSTNDVQFISKNLPLLEKEFNFWMNNRSLVVQHPKTGRDYTVIRYNVEFTGPRPESYREDYDLAEKLRTKEEKDELYFNFKSGAESGWDFSSRWFVHPEGVKGTLSDTKVRHIVPVELNALMQYNAQLLADFYRLTGSPQNATKYENIANEWREMMNELLWDDSLGCWFDYDTISKKLRTEFYPSNLFPLWTWAMSPSAAKKPPSRIVNKVLGYLRSTGALEYPGGVPTSLAHAGEQWDYPNGWAPLQHIVVDALDNCGNSEAKILAFEIAEKWVSSNYKAFQQSNKMFEKYDVTVVGLPGGGGEYEVVVGFGWSNGVVLDFLNRYGHKLVAPSLTDTISSGGSATAMHKPHSYITNSLLFGSLSVLLASIIGISQRGKCKENCVTFSSLFKSKTPLTDGRQGRGSNISKVGYSPIPLVMAGMEDEDEDIEAEASPVANNCGNKNKSQPPTSPLLQTEPTKYYKENL